MSALSVSAPPPWLPLPSQPSSQNTTTATGNTPPPPPPPPGGAPPPSGVAGASASAPVQRAADGDYKVASAQTSQVRDKDGDYKPLSAAAPSPAQSSSAVQASLTSLLHGG